MVVIYLTFLTVPADIYTAPEGETRFYPDHLGLLFPSDSIWMIPGTCDPSED